MTAAKLASPRQVYSSLNGNIDAAANFSESGLKGVTVTSSEIAAHELQVAIPEATTSAQWEKVNKGVTVKVGVLAPGKTGVAEFKVEPWAKN